MSLLHRLREVLVDPLLGFAQVAVVVIGIALALYGGLWVLLVGGATDVLNLLKSPGEISTEQLGMAALKIIAGLVAWPICVGGASVVAVGLSGMKTTAAKTDGAARN